MHITNADPLLGELINQ